MFEDSLRSLSDGGHSIDLKPHIRHYLSLTDDCFQKHVAFPFVMMNILQCCSISFQSKLAFKCSWFPAVSAAMDKINPEELSEMLEKLKNNPNTKPASECEKAAAELIQYVNYISDQISGSPAEVNTMREEICAITRSTGLPHLFVTINIADFHNPVSQVFAGQDINLNEFFDKAAGSAESFTRATTIAQNPVAAAKAFSHLIEAFTGILLGTKREDRIGVFGKVNSYYGVVEAQGRGSLHCYFFVWLENGLSPMEVCSKAKDNLIWSKQLFDWLDDIISQSLPDNTTPYIPEPCEPEKKPVFCRPLDPTKPDFDVKWQQDLFNILHCTGQIHVHKDTCFKHLPKTIRDLKDPDKDCCFELPRETVVETYMDEDGHIHLQCRNGNLNGFNDICVSCLCCNMDIKYIGSGTAVMAMVEYVTNYIAKMSLDSSTVFTALCAALKSVSDNPALNPITEEVDNKEQSRQVLLKTCNGMIGKCELSSQQVACFLCNIPNRFTDHNFDTLYWTSILDYTAPNAFAYLQVSDDDENLEDPEAIGDIHPLVEMDSSTICNNMSIDQNDSGMMFLDTLFHSQVSDLSGLPLHTTFSHDMLFRPESLNNLCLWDLFRLYTKVTLPKPKQSKDKAAEMLLSDNDIVSAKHFHFRPGHPQYTTHCLKLRHIHITPVLIGRGVPQRDKIEHADAHAATMLTLFKPWSSSTTSPLKSPSASWTEAYTEFVRNLDPQYMKRIDNMQAVHECKDAAHDYAAICKNRLAELRTLAGAQGFSRETDADDENPFFTAAMETPIQDMDLDNCCGIGKRTLNDMAVALTIAERGGLYSFTPTTPGLALPFTGTVCEASPADIFNADISMKSIMAKKQRLLDSRSAVCKQVTTKNNQSLSIRVPGNPVMTTLVAEEALAKKKYAEQHGSDLGWYGLEPYQHLYLSLIEKFTLTDEQTLAFLLFADHHGRVMKGEKLPPLRMMLSGPGGAGKSQVFDALRTFYAALGDSDLLKITAPTGLAACNVGGSTIHSEASLCVSHASMLADTPNGEKNRTGLEQRWQGITTLICDEIYFLSLSDFAHLSENLQIAKEVTNPDTILGNMNVLFAGDPAQLPPPNADALFNHKIVQAWKKPTANATNENDCHKLQGLVTWRQVTCCVMLTKLMCQKEPIFQELLTRLRYGVCTERDYEFLQQFLIKNRPDEINRKLLSIDKWIYDPLNASPLICYTNAMRDAHNLRCAEAFAKATHQEYHLYHSVDTKTIKGKVVTLKNAAAEAAWSAPVKAAKDLAGRLPLIPGMPVFLTENLAPELGLSNGAEGRVVSLKYIVRDGKRYAVSVDVNFQSYNNLSSANPHQLTLGRFSGRVEYKVPGLSTTAARLQIPLIPAFAYTAHNSQGRSLNAACIDFTSCNELAMTYVMLSRIRSLEGITILRPFPIGKINSHAPQAVRNELIRLDVLATASKEQAQKDLSWYYT